MKKWNPPTKAELSTDIGELELLQFCSDLIAKEDDHRNPKLVVRVSTSYWHDHNGLYKKKTIKYLKRKSINMDDALVHEDCNNVGADVAIDNILNLDDVKDGIYEMRICNVDYEYSEGFSTGYIDSWNYELIPYTE